MNGVVKPLGAFRTLSRQRVMAAMHDGGQVLDEVRRLIDAYVARMQDAKQRGQVPADVLTRIAPRWPIEAVVREMMTDIVRQFPANDDEPER
jgi:hypothetical protein